MKIFTLLTTLAIGIATISSAAGAETSPKRAHDFMGNTEGWKKINKTHKNNSNQQKVSESETPSMVWGWCEEPSSKGPFPAGLYCISAIGITEEITEKFDGCYIESIIVNKGFYTENEPVIDLMLFKGTKEYDAEWDDYTLYGEKPFLLKKDVPFVGEEGEWVEFALDEPYKIEADNVVYVGWGYYNLNDDNMPLVCDDVLNANPDTSWMMGDSPDDPSYEFWSNCWTAGANCIRMRLSGDNLPSDDAALIGIETPRFVSLNQPAEVALTVSNQASTVINDLGISYAIAGEEAKTTTVSGLDLAPGKLATIKLDDITLSKEGNVRLDVEIVTVNGNEDYNVADNMISTSILCLAEGNGYERKVVVEEGTGTWCINCPRGIVGMREMAKKYPDNFIGIAVHSGDEMEIEAYWPYLERYIDPVGFPYSTVDRAISGDPSFNELESNFLQEAEVPSLAKVSISDISIEGKTLKFTSSVEFAVSENYTEYGWAYVITEDNVGPYVQKSRYTEEGELEGWDSTQTYVVMTFDEVACAAEDVMGAFDLPSSTEAGTNYTKEAVLDAEGVADFSNAHIIAMVINKTTGYIENAAKVSLSDYSVVNGIKDSTKSRLNVSNGIVTLVSGDNATIYSTSGMVVGKLHAGESIKLAKGIYLVKSGKNTNKVVVK